MKRSRVITVTIATSGPFDFFARYAYAKCNINITQLARDLTDIYALSLGRCAPEGVVCIIMFCPICVYWPIYTRMGYPAVRVQDNNVSHIYEYIHDILATCVYLIR